MAPCMALMKAGFGMSSPEIWPQPSSPRSFRRSKTLRATSCSLLLPAVRTGYGSAAGASTMNASVARAEGLQVDAVGQLAPELGRGDGARLVAGVVLDAGERLLPHALAAGHLVQVAHAAEVLHVLVVPAQHAERVHGVRPSQGQAKDAHVVADAVHRLAPLAVAAEDGAQLLQAAGQARLAQPVERR